MTDEFPKNTALITDIAAGVASTLYGRGSSTLPAFVDLANICQSAVMNDVLLASPIAIENNELLGSLGQVSTLDTSSIDHDGEIAEELERSETRQDSPSPSEAAKLLPDAVNDPIQNVWLQSFKIRLEDPMFGSLVNPGTLDDSVDRGLHLVRKLPAAMLFLHAVHGVDVFDDEEAKADFLERARPTLDRFDRYAFALTHLYREQGIDSITSTLEQTIVDGRRIEYGFGGGDLAPIHAEIARRVDMSVREFRCLALEEYKLPAIGLHVLAEAKDLDDLPRAIDQFRDRFKKLRGSIVTLEKQRWSAMASGERGRRDLARICRDLDHAFKAFNEKIEDPYITKDITQKRSLLSGAKVIDEVTAIIKSFGTSLLKVKKFLDLFNAENRVDMWVVPGLFKAAGVIENIQVPTVSAVARRYLHLSENDMQLPRFMMVACTQRIQSIYGLADFSDGTGISTEDGEFVPVTKLWTRMLQELSRGETTMADRFLAGKTGDQDAD